MILMVNGVEQNVSDPMDALTRAVIISFFHGGARTMMIHRKRPTGGGGILIPVRRMIVLAPGFTC